MHWDLESCRAQQWPVPTYGIMELDDTGVTLCWVIGHYLLLLYYMYYIKSQCPTQPHLGLILSAYTIILLTLNHGSIPCWNRWNLILMYYQMISLNVIYSCVLNCFIRGLDKNWIELNRQWSSNKNHGLLPVLQRLLNYTKIQMLIHANQPFNTTKCISYLHIRFSMIFSTSGSQMLWIPNDLLDSCYY